MTTFWAVTATIFWLLAWLRCRDLRRKLIDSRGEADSWEKACDNMVFQWRRVRDERDAAEKRLSEVRRAFGVTNEKVSE